MKSLTHIQDAPGVPRAGFDAAALPRAAESARLITGRRSADREIQTSAQMNISRQVGGERVLQAALREDRFVFLSPPHESEVKGKVEGCMQRGKGEGGRGKGGAL